MPYFCVGESVKSEFAVVRPHSTLAHSSKWQLLYAVGKGNQFDDEYDTNIDSVKEFISGCFGPQNRIASY